MEIRITGDPVIDNLKSRKETMTQKIRELAYERICLAKRMEELDKLIGQLEAAQMANDLVQKDIDLRETISKAQKEAVAKTSSVNKNMEVK